jgi:hypothetical protein
MHAPIPTLRPRPFNQPEPPTARPQPRLIIRADKAKRLILEHRAPAGMRVNGELDLIGANIRFLPENLECSSLNLMHCPNLRELPHGLRCQHLRAYGLCLKRLPSDLRVRYRLELNGCVELEYLPEDLSVGALCLAGCHNLRALPEGLDVSFLDISGCTKLERFPTRGHIQHGHLTARDCINLRELPHWLESLSQVDLTNCSSLTALPSTLRVHTWLEVGGTQIRDVHDLTTPLRWYGEPIDLQTLIRTNCTLHPQSSFGGEGDDKHRPYG